MSPSSPPIPRVPVWVWRSLMLHIQPRERRRFSENPIDSVEYFNDIDYVGSGDRAQRLDVILPRVSEGPLPVYVYFHGGGWTSGDKAVLTRYCASQAETGMVVVNVNYRMATRFHMQHIMQDANAAAAWVVEHIAQFGGDPSRIILGGDSAGGQIAALLAATSGQSRLAEHYLIEPALPGAAIRGVVQHCSAVDFSVMFERGFLLGLGFVRMLLPERGRGLHLPRAARYLSPIEWVHEGYPPVFVTTSRKDFFYRANLNFIRALEKHRVPVDSHFDHRARHTWQQDSRHPSSSAVYERLQAFVSKVALPARAHARAGH
jgi:acetyl esterase